MPKFMTTRFIIGSTQIDVHTQYYVYDQATKTTLYYPTIDPWGKIKSAPQLQKELTEYCALLNQQSAAGEFTTNTATLTKKQADYIVRILESRDKLCQDMLHTAYADKKHNHNIPALQDEYDTISSICRALSPIRFPQNILLK